jgi:hypothetical protein
MTRTADRLPPRTRIVDRTTGKRGLITGYGTTLSPVPGVGGRQVPIILWDGTGNAVPWAWSTEALEAEA